MNVWSIFGSIGLDTRDAERGLKRSEDAAKRTAGVMERDVTRGLDAVAAKLNRVAESFTRVGSELSLKVTAPLVAFGALALRTAGDFESSMNRVAAVSGATGAQLDALTAKAREMGATTQFSASQAADAMGFMAMAGMRTDEILGSMESTLRLAAAAQLDMGTAADVVTNILAGYNMTVNELDHAVDVLTKTFTSANTDLGMLAVSMRYVGPVAVAAGVQFEETAAAIGLLGNAGIQGSAAGTALRQAILNLLNPTSAAAAAMERIGLTATDANGRLLPLADIVDQLGETYEDTASLAEIFGARNVGALSALASQGGDALRALTAELETSGGTAERVASVQMQGFNGAILELRSAFEELQIAVAGSGLLRWAENAARGLSEFLRSIAALDPAILRFGTITAGVFAAAGPILLGVGAGVRAFSTLLLGVNAVRTATLALAVGPAAPFVILATLVGGLVTLWNTNALDIQGRTEGMVGSMRASFERVRESFATVVTALQEAWERFSSAITPVWDSFKDRAGEALAIVVTSVLNGVVMMLNSLDWLIRFGVSLVENWGALGAAWESILRNMSAIAENTGTIIRLGFDVALLGVQGAFTTLFRFVETGMQGMINGLLSGLNAVIREINNVFGTAHAEIGRVAMNAWEGIDAANARAINLAMADMRLLRDMNSDMLGNVRNVVVQFAELVEAGMARGQTAAEATTAATEALGVTLEDVTTALDEALGGAAGGAAGAAFGEAFADGVDGPVAGSLDALKAQADAAWAAFNAAGDDASRATALAFALEMQTAYDDMRDRWAAKPLQVPIELAPIPGRAGVPLPGATVGGDLGAFERSSPIYEATRAAVQAGITDGFDDGMALIPRSGSFSSSAIPIPGVTASVASARSIVPGVSVNDVAVAWRELREAARAERVALYAEAERRRADAAQIASYGQFTNFMNQPGAIPIPGIGVNVAAPVPVDINPQVSVAPAIDIASQVTAAMGENVAAIKSTVDALNELRARSQATVNAVAAFGDALLSRVPILGEAFNALNLSVDEATGKIQVAFDPVQFLAELLGRLLSASERLTEWIGRVMEALQPLAEMLGDAVVQALGPFVDALVQLLGAVMPIVVVLLELLGAGLRPLAWLLTNVVAPAFKFVADAIVAIYNALLGWLFGRIDTDARSTTRSTTRTGAEEAGAGTGWDSSNANAWYGEDRGAGRQWGYTGITAPTGSIAYYNQKIQAVRSVLDNSRDPVEREAARAEIARLEAMRDALTPTPTPTPTPSQPTSPTFTSPSFTTPSFTTPDRPVTWGDGDLNPSTPLFGTAGAAVQMAVATPIVEASINMLEASRVMQNVFGGMLPTSTQSPEAGISAMPPFTAALERLTPVLERLMAEGVSISASVANTGGAVTRPSWFPRYV